MKRFKHLSLEEREILYGGLKQGQSLRAIGRQLGRDHTTLADELKRNKKAGRISMDQEYLPCKAQQLSDRRACAQRTKAPLKNLLVWVYVREHLKEPYEWSPETIAGRLPLDHKGQSIDDETIYRYIHGRGKKYKLWQFLTLKRKKRMKKEGRKVQKKGRIPEAVSIEKRPKVVDRRKQSGHWESDNMIGKVNDLTALSNTVERVTRITILSKVARGADSKTQALFKRLSPLPVKVLKTLTEDNGKENTHHIKITKGLGLKVFFCHAYASWEKGSVENMNGRVRRFIPKGVSIDPISEEYIAVVEYRLNNTPRKCLGYRTPYEKMSEILEKLKS